MASEKTLMGEILDVNEARNFKGELLDGSETKILKLKNAHLPSAHVKTLANMLTMVVDTPNAKARSGLNPSEMPMTNPAKVQSPAPTVDSGVTGGEVASHIPLSVTSTAPAASKVMSAMGRPRLTSLVTATMTGS